MTRFWSAMVAVCRANAGNDEEALRPGGVRGLHFAARADDAVEAGVARKSASRSTWSCGIAAHAGRCKSRWSRLVSTVTADDLGPGGAAALASSIIARPPAAWTVRIAGSMRAQRLDRLGDGVGDVVELQVEEDRQAELGQP